MDISEVDLYCDLNANSKLYIKQKSYEWNFVKKKKKLPFKICVQWIFNAKSVSSFFSW